MKLIIFFDQKTLMYAFFTFWGLLRVIKNTFFSDTITNLGAPKNWGPQANVYLPYGLRLKAAQNVLSKIRTKMNLI